MGSKLIKTEKKGAVTTQRRKYGGYHGRTTARDVLRLTAALLLVLLVLAAVALAVGQRYIIYTDDGVRLELPFFRRDDLPAEEDSPSLDIIQRPMAFPSESEGQPPAVEELSE